MPTTPDKKGFISNVDLQGPIAQIERTQERKSVLKSSSAISISAARQVWLESKLGLTFLFSSNAPEKIKTNPGLDASGFTEKEPVAVEIVFKEQNPKGKLEAEIITYIVGRDEITQTWQARCYEAESRRIDSASDKVPTNDGVEPVLTFFAEDRHGNPEQSDAILLEYNGYVIGIDVGKGTVDVFEKKEGKGKGKYDLLLLSHFDTDHIGEWWAEFNAANIIDEGRATFAVATDTWTKTGAGKDVAINMTEQEAKGNMGIIPVGAEKFLKKFMMHKVYIGHPDTVAVSETDKTIDYTKMKKAEKGIFMEILGPHKDHHIGKNGKIGKSAEGSNNNSLITLISAPGLKSLFLGDAGVDALVDMWDYVKKNNIDLTGVDSLKLPHHGSFSCLQEGGALDDEQYKFMLKMAGDKEGLKAFYDQYENYDVAVAAKTKINPKTGEPEKFSEAEKYKMCIMARIIQETNCKKCVICCGNSGPRDTAPKPHPQVLGLCEAMKLDVLRTSRSRRIQFIGRNKEKNKGLEVIEERATRIGTTKDGKDIKYGNNLSQTNEASVDKERQKITEIRDDGTEEITYCAKGDLKRETPTEESPAKKFKLG